MTGESSQRIFGLDLLRTIAILIVVLEHSLPLVSEHFEVLKHLALPDGVDLFFVLSGFLIGGKLISGIEIEKHFRFQQLSSFLQRRWRRTLPNYFLFLGLNLVLIHFALIKGEINTYLLTYFCFLQNMFTPVDFLFWESWSLAVEEWFYLLFPLLLFLLFRIRSSLVSIKRNLLFAILFFLLLPLLYRFYSLYFLPSHKDWDLFYRKLVSTRLDAMGFGLLAAYLKHYAPRLWNFRSGLFFLIGVIGLFLLTYFSNAIHNHYTFSRTLYFSLSAFLVLLLLPQLDQLRVEPFVFKPFAFISRISYSMYLLHLPLYQILFNHFDTSNTALSLLMYGFYWALTIGLSYLIYRYYEKPLMHKKTTNAE
ncbi:MAG: acyltransferase [Bacteroidia bacterium]|jgi:peptidoglycan/LPS O-acetylase OafA/YrhL|nr:acyltransferase [Bacteroidia bacterium]